MWTNPVKNGKSIKIIETDNYGDVTNLI